jgi:excisionase family DNA binding protein
MSKIVTAREVADYLRLSSTTIHNLAMRGDLPGFKIGKSWRFDMDEIMAAVKGAKDNIIKDCHVLKYNK